MDHGMGPMPGGGGHDGGGGMDMMMTMQMYFEASTRATLWFKQWTSHNVGEYLLSLIALFLLCVAHEALTTFRVQYLSRSAKKSDSQVGAAETSLLTGLSQIRYRPGNVRVRAVATGLYAANLTLSYLLMLAVMTFNVGYFVVIVLGLSFGHFVFFRDNPASSDICHAQVLAVDPA